MSNPFTNWSAADVAKYNARVRHGDEEDEAKYQDRHAPRPVKHESDLHDDIEKELKRRGWYYVHSRMDRATTQAKGVPDFIVAVPLQRGVACGHSRTLWIEAKGANGKLTPEQAGALAWLDRDGHETAIVRSLEEFLALIQ